MATHSSILAWRVPWTEEPGGLQSKRVAKSQSRLSAHARIAALQRGGGFCCTTKQISHTYTCIRSFFGLSSHLGHQRVLGRVPCAVQQFSSVLFYTQQCTYVSPNLPIRLIPSSPRGIHTFVLYICVSISALQIGSPVPFLQILHICINIQYLFFFFFILYDSFQVHSHLCKQHIFLCIFKTAY